MPISFFLDQAMWPGQAFKYAYQNLSVSSAINSSNSKLISKYQKLSALEDQNAVNVIICQNKSKYQYFFQPVVNYALLLKVKFIFLEKRKNVLYKSDF